MRTRALPTIGRLLGSRPWLQGLLVAGLVAGVLLPALQADLIWDDMHQIRDSETIRDWRCIPELFRLNVIRSTGSEGYNAEGLDIYRPLFMTALVALYAIDGPSPFWFHAGSLAVHVLVCFVLWLLARRWLTSDPAAWLVVLLFAFHPVAAEAFLWPSAISDPMSLLGLLVAVWLLDPPRPTRASLAGDSWQSAQPGWAACVAASLAILGGLLSKEVMLAALPAVGLWLYRARGVAWTRLAPGGLAAVVFLLLRSAALGGLEATGADGPQRLLALRYLPVVLVDSLRALVLTRPIGARHLWFEYRDLGPGVSELALLIVALLVIGIWRLRKVSPLVALAGGVAFMVLAPVALVATVPGWGGFARYIYLPWAFGACAVIELGQVLVEQRGARIRKVLIVVLVAWLGAQQIGLRRALEVYSSQEELARSAIAIDPDGPPGHEWLGNVWLQRGDLARALEQYRLALAGEPSLYRPHLNVAACLVYLDRPGEALREIARLEARHGRTERSSEVAVRALVRLGRTAEALERLHWALERAPDSQVLRRLEADVEAFRQAD